MSPNTCLTKATRYWGHEHDYRNNLISVRWGGVVPRRLPCDRKESENLRDGPFSGFRSPSSATAGNNAAEKSPMKGERIKQDALPEANAEVLEGQDSGDKQAPGTVGNSPDGPSLTSTNKGEDAEGEEFDAWSETEQDRTLVADEDGVGEDVFDVVPEAGEEAAQPFQWQSDVLCVADPFIDGKVKFDESIDALSYVTFLITEPDWTHQTECCRSLSGRLPACGDATAHGRKS
jgi:hypothetical protein